MCAILRWIMPRRDPWWAAHKPANSIRLAPLNVRYVATWGSRVYQRVFNPERQHSRRGTDAMGNGLPIAREGTPGVDYLITSNELISMTLLPRCEVGAIIPHHFVSGTRRQIQKRKEARITIMRIIQLNPNLEDIHKCSVFICLHVTFVVLEQL